MRKTVAKRIRGYIADQGIAPEMRTRATKITKRAWNTTPQNKRHALAVAMES